MATLPYNALTAMQMPQVQASLETLLQLEREMESLKNPLADDLFVLVSELGEQEVAQRRAALKLKRNIHNGKPYLGDPQLLSQLLERMSKSTCSLLNQWQAAFERYQQTLAQAQQGFDEELQQLRQALRAPLSRPLFSRALAFASVGVANNARQEKQLPRKAGPDNFERSLLGYLLRAAAKTSPFSSFMSMTAVPVIFSEPTEQVVAEQLNHECRTRLNRGIPARIYKHVAKFAIQKNLMKVRLNSSFRQQDEQKFIALCERDMVLLGRPWTELRAANFRLHKDIGRLFMQGPKEDTWANWRQRLIDACAMDEQQAEGLLDKFFSKGLLTIAPFTNSFDPQPELTLVNLLEQLSLPQVQQVSKLVSNMIGACEQIAVDNSEDRATKVEDIRSFEQRIMKAVGAPRYEAYHNVVLEDCWCSGIKGKLGADSLAQLQGLHEFLAGQVVYLPEYLRLRGHFIERFGEGGECRQLDEFLIQVSDKMVELPEYGAQSKKLETLFAPKGTRLGVTAQVQLIDEPDQDGAAQIVVNRVFDRPAWLASRFAFGEQPEQQFLKQGLTDWLNQLCGDAEPVDLLINGHNNDLQAHPRLTKRTLSWPSDPLASEQANSLDISSLILRHNAETDQLELFDGEGKAIKLLYLGSTFPTPAWGIPYALSILTHPFTLSRPHFKPPVLSATEEVIENPRIQHGETILSRAFWWVKAEYLLEKWFAKPKVEGLLAIRRECEKYQLPHSFFVQRYNGGQDNDMISSDVLKGERKPLWVSIDNPFSLDLLKRLSQKSNWLSVSEALPGPQQLWLEVDGHKHVSELQVEMAVVAG